MLPVALEPMELTAGFQITPVSRFVPNPTKSANVDPLAKEPHRHLLELTKQAFPRRQDSSSILDEGGRVGYKMKTK